MKFSNTLGLIVLVMACTSSDQGGTAKRATILQRAGLYGYSVAAELQPELRYDKVVKDLGGHGELVREPGELVPALERAFASGRPALVNVLTDPSVAYPHKANLA